MDINSKPMKIITGICFGSVFLNIGQFLGVFTSVVHWHLLLAVVVFIVIDFFTAMAKLKVMKVEPSSEGYRKSIVKFSQYGGAIGVSYLLWFLFKANLPNASIILNMILLAVIFVEITSIFENLYEVDHKSYFAKYFIYPVLWIMKFSMVKNPLMKQMEKMQQQEEAEKSKP